jgi:nonribosomal peptide synthetase DhbF
MPHSSGDGHACQYPGWLDKCRCSSPLEKKFLYEEIFIQQQYFPKHGVDISSSRPIVIDVGANVGLFSIYCSERLGFRSEGALVVSLEPVPNTFRNLQHNIQMYQQWCISGGIPVAKIVPLQLAMVEKGGDQSTDFVYFPYAQGWGCRQSHVNIHQIQADLRAFVDNCVEDPNSRSLPRFLKHLGWFLKRYIPILYACVISVCTWLLLFRRTTVHCPCKTLSDVIRENGIDHVDLLKIDVEGSEIMVLEGIHEDHWPMIRALVAEVHEKNLKEFVTRCQAQYKRQVYVEQTKDMKNTSLWMVYCV